MPTTSVFNGTSLVVLIGTEVIGFATSCSLSLAIIISKMVYWQAQHLLLSMGQYRKLS